jgi:hypothetical protein
MGSAFELFRGAVRVELVMILDMMLEALVNKSTFGGGESGEFEAGFIRAIRELFFFSKKMGMDSMEQQPL